MTDEEKILSDLKGIAEYFMELYREEEDREVYDQHYDRMVVVSNACNLIEELLKDQEPRVLTLEELRSLNGTDHFVWFEDNGGYDFYDCYAEVITYRNNVELNTFGSEVEFEPDNEEYGKTWRCWSSRPTDEQREAVPWQ